MIRSEVLVRGPARFDMCGQRLPDSLHDTDQTISQGLANRLRAYALGQLDASGSDVQAWACSVYTMDGDLPPAERFYCVDFTNEKGGALGVQGIMTRKGWPWLNHGLTIAA